MLAILLMILCGDLLMISATILTVMNVHMYLPLILWLLASGAGIVFLTCLNGIITVNRTQ